MSTTLLPACEPMSLENIPNERISSEFGFGNLRISILVHGRLDIEHSRYASDDKGQGPESKVSAGTDPEDHRSGHSLSREMRTVPLTSFQYRKPYLRG